MSETFAIGLVIAVLLAAWVKSQGVKRGSDNVIAGVCSGIAKRTGWDLTVVRVIAVILGLAFGVMFWAYILLWIILDQE